MNGKTAVLLIVFGFFACPLQILAQKTNYSGTWVLNLEKSKLESHRAGLTSSLFVIKQDGDNFELTRYHILATRKKSWALT